MERGATGDWLTRQPGDRVALAAAGAVLDQVAAAGTVRARVGDQTAHAVEPVIAKQAAELPGRRFAVIVDEAHSAGNNLLTGCRP